MDEELLKSLKESLTSIFASSDSIAEKIQRIERVPIIPFHSLKGIIASSSINIIEEIQKIIYLYAYAPNERLISSPIMNLTKYIDSIMPVLTEAIDAGYSKTIAILANVIALEHDKCIASHKAVLNKFLEQGQISYARALLDHGAEVNKLNALLTAIEGSYNPDMFEMLLQHKADVHESSSLSPLAHAFECNNIQAVRWLIDKGADAGALVEGETILKRCPPRKTYEPGAVLPQCDLNIIKILIDNGAKMEPYKDRSPLCFFIAKAI